MLPNNHPRANGGDSAIAAWLFTIGVLALQVLMVSSGWGGETLIIGSCLAMACLITVWCAVIPGAWLYLVALPLLLFDGLLLTSAAPSFSVWLLVMPLVIATPIATALECTKFVFGRFEKREQQDLLFAEGLQFKLSHLFVATTIAAAVCGIGRFLYPFSVNSDERILWSVFILASVISANTLFAVWAILGNTLSWRLCILIAMAAATSAAGTYLGAVPPAPPSALAVWAGFFAIVFAITTIHLLLLRKAGFRFVKRGTPFEPLAD